MRALDDGDWQAGVAAELSSALLGDIEARAVQRVEGLLEQGAAALQAYQLKAAGEAYATVQAGDGACRHARQQCPGTRAVATAVPALEALKPQDSWTRRVRWWTPARRATDNAFTQQASRP